MSEMQEMFAETVRCHARGILVNKATRRRLGEKSPELTLEEMSIETRLDGKQFTLQGWATGRAGRGFQGRKLFTPLLIRALLWAPECARATSTR